MDCYKLSSDCLSPEIETQSISKHTVEAEDKGIGNSLKAELKNRGCSSAHRMEGQNRAPETSRAPLKLSHYPWLSREVTAVLEALASGLH